MAFYKKESLQKLKDTIDMVDVASSFMNLKRSGNIYKGLCPFHEEKTPSFIIQAGETHYHCFGCQEHGDAIQFVMKMMQLSFVEAIEYLAQKYSILLEKEEKGASNNDPSTGKLKEAMEKASQFYQFILLRTPEGKEALSYLFKRGIELPYIKRFEIGLAPKNPNLLSQVLQKQGIPLSIAKLAGLLSTQGLDLFSQRITFPIHDRLGSIIGFSARAFQPSYKGGKYINTPLTPLFKKSQIFFGLPFSKKRMAKEKRAVLVEGQIDALSLIYHGLDYTVATLGTALTDQHVKQLIQLGVEYVTLVFDEDEAGLKAAFKAGSLLQASGLVVSICLLKEAKDPHDFLQTYGIDSLKKRLEEKIDYLQFAISILSRGKDSKDPGFKAKLVAQLKQQIQSWQDPVLVHETLKKLSQLLDVPIHLITSTSILPTKTKQQFNQEMVKRALEMDVLYYLLFADDEKKTMLQIASQHLKKEHFTCQDCSLLFETIMEKRQNEDLLQLCIDTNEKAMYLLQALSEKKRENTKKEKPFLQTIERLMQRKWLEEREKIKEKLQSGILPDEEALKLAQQFDEMKNNPPVII